jgi:hypothetical protein
MIITFRQKSLYKADTLVDIRQIIAKTNLKSRSLVQVASFPFLNGEEWRPIARSKQAAKMRRAGAARLVSHFGKAVAYPPQLAVVAMKRTCRVATVG